MVKLQITRINSIFMLLLLFRKIPLIMYSYHQHGRLALVIHPKEQKTGYI